MLEQEEGIADEISAPAVAGSCSPEGEAGVLTGGDEISKGEGVGIGPTAHLTLEIGLK